jgi:hypothetical protein
VSAYLPLCAFRQELLPSACLSCVWWQTRGEVQLSPEAAAAERRRWVTSVESTWGTTGLLLEGTWNSGGGAFATGGQDSKASTGGAPGPVLVASISFAPAALVPRLRDLPFAAFPDGSALVFCLACDESQPRYQAGRILRKALGRLRARGVEEAYALATIVADAEAPATCVGDASDGNRCRFFAFDFLSANGFEQLADCHGLALMRIDLRGLLALVGQVQTAVRRALSNEPAPSPAAWTRRQTT